tara:strand:- start:1173 stop:1685 length:513 start_codon:yes stop_codon:yes gene_type:complete
MNIFITGTIIFILVYLILNRLAKANSKKIAKGVRNLIIILSLILAVILLVGGRLLFSLPLFFLAMSALKIKGLTAFQIWNLWRVLNYLRSTGRFSYFGNNNETRPSNSISTEEAYKVLGLKPGCSKNDVIKACNNLQKKLHPDVNPNSNTERLSQIINEAKEIIIKNDFS